MASNSEEGGAEAESYRMRALAGWRGAGILAALAAIAIALPLAFGTGDTGEHATWDWSFPFVTILFVVLPVLSVLNALLTLVLARMLTGRGRWIELASLAVPGAILAAAREGYVPVLRLFLESN